MTRRPTQRDRGAILVLVLVIVAVLSIVAASQLFTTRSELGAATAAQHGYQARAAAMSGIQRAMTLLWNEPNNLQDRFDKPEIFQAQQVSPDETSEPWFFTVFAPNFDDPDHVRYGLEDESGKLVEQILHPGDIIENKPYRKHRIEALEDTRLIEASTPQLDDVVRVEDDYVR